jgi:acetolactate synthase small subunit
VRVTVEVIDRPGKLYELTGAIQRLGGNINGMGAIQGESSATREITFKVAGVELKTLAEALRPLVEKMIDIRDEKG